MSFLLRRRLRPVLNYRSPAGPPLTFVRGTPALQSVGCNGTGPCVGGTLLTVTGTDFGGVGNASTTALVFSGVAALRPLCPLLTLRPTRRGRCLAPDIWHLKCDTQKKHAILV